MLVELGSGTGEFKFVVVEVDFQPLGFPLNGRPRNRQTANRVLRTAAPGVSILLGLNEP